MKSSFLKRRIIGAKYYFHILLKNISDFTTSIVRVFFYSETRFICGFVFWRNIFYRCSFLIKKGLNICNDFIRIRYVVHTHCPHHSLIVSFGKNINGSIIKKACNFTWKCGTNGFDFIAFNRLNTWEYSALIYEKYFSRNNHIIIHFKVNHSFSIELQKNHLNKHNNNIESEYPYMTFNMSSIDKNKNNLNNDCTK